MFITGGGLVDLNPTIVDDASLLFARYHPDRRDPPRDRTRIVGLVNRLDQMSLQLTQDVLIGLNPQGQTEARVRGAVIRTVR